MRILRLFFAVVVLASSAPAFAVQPDEVLPNAALEARARSLSKEVRCMVCQNQSIDDSDAPLARDLRVLLRERLVAGDSDQQVMDFLVARYGEFVLLKPRLSWHTLLLWGGPAMILLGGIFGLITFARRRRLTSLIESGELTAAERARLKALQNPLGFSD